MTPELRNALLQLTEALRAERISLNEWREAVVTLLTEAVPDINDEALARAVGAVRGTETPEDVVTRLEALTTPDSNGLALATGVALAAFLAQAALRTRSAETTRSDAPDAKNALLEAAQRRFEQRTAQLAAALADGRLTVEEWRVAFASEVADLHVAAYVIGAGGVEQLDAEDFAVLNAKIDEQLGYLNEWAAELEGGELPRLKALQARQNLYAGAANATLYEAQAQSIGISLPQQPGDGKTRCRTNCHCTLRFERRDDGIAVWWVLHPAEHCEDCKALAAAWNPLLIALPVAA